MAGLSIPSFGTVTIAQDGGAEREYREIGSRDYAFDGTLHNQVRARKGVWRFRTVPLSTADAASIRTQLSCTPPLACYGDLLNVSSSTTGNFAGELVSESFIRSSTALKIVLDFRLHEV